MESIGRAVTDNAAEGFIKAAHRSNETVLGATVVESQAAGTSRDWSIAAARGLEMAMWRRHIHPQPRATTNCLGHSPGGLTQRLAGRALRWLGRQPSPRLGTALLAAQFPPHFVNFGVAQDAEHVDAPVLDGYSPDGVAAVLHRD